MLNYLKLKSYLFGVDLKKDSIKWQKYRTNNRKYLLLVVLPKLSGLSMNQVINTIFMEHSARITSLQ